MKSFEVYYFDGKSSKPILTTLELHDSYVYIRDTNIYYDFKDVEVGIKLINTPQKLSFKDGSSCEIKNDKIFSLPNKTGDKFVRELESKLKYAVFGLLIIVAIIVSSLTFGSTKIANVLSEKIPQDMSNMLSKNSLEFLDKYYFKSSNISLDTQNYINSEFQKLVKNSNHTYNISFRSSSALGANAFALPSGDIILLDDLIYLDNDENFRGILSILAHEVGHVEYKHGLKNVIKSSIISVVVGYFIGDFSGVAASLATFTINADYSKEFEKEADDYAISLLKQNNISTKYLVNIFEKFLEKEGEEFSETLSTHPLIKNRIEKLKKNEL